MYRLALIVKDSQAPPFTVLVKPCSQPLSLASATDDEQKDAPLWDLPSVPFPVIDQHENVYEATCTVTPFVQKTLKDIGIFGLDAGNTVFQLKSMLLPIWAQMQPWIYWKFVEEPDFGSGPEIHTVLFMTNVNVEEDVSTIGKWVTSEYAWSQLMAGKKETDARLGPLAAFAFSPHFPQSLRHRLKLSMNVQEYPPGVLVLPLKSATLKPFSKTNLVAFSSMGMLDQGAVTGLRGESLIVDPGCHPRDAQDALSMVVKSLPKKMFIFLTHHHLDHTEGLPTVYKENPEAVILAHELTIKRLGKVAKKLKCIPIADGMTIIIGSEELQVIAAPGHTDGHMALLHVLSHTLIVGDHCVGFAGHSGKNFSL